MITWIRDNVAIGDSQDAKRAKEEGFTATLNVAIDLDIKDEFQWRHKIGLVDGRGNHPLTFLAAVTLLESLVQSGKRVLVHCHSGQSRSVMVAATWIAVNGFDSLDGALDNIMRARKIPLYRPELYALATTTIPIIQTYAKPAGYF